MERRSHPTRSFHVSRHHINSTPVHCLLLEVFVTPPSPGKTHHHNNNTGSGRDGLRCPRGREREGLPHALPQRPADHHVHRRRRGRDLPLRAAGAEGDLGHRVVPAGRAAQGYLRGGALHPQAAQVDGQDEGRERSPQDQERRRRRSG